jgi:glycosyltransferase involved in cell wall biosynthesis
MRVMILSALYPPLIHGGAEKAAWQLAEALVAEGDDVAVITMHPGSEESAETLNGVRVYRIPMDNLYWPFGNKVKPSAPSRLRWHLRDMWNRRTAARVGRILDIENPEVVNSHLIIGFSPAVWREVKRRGIRLVHTLHDYYLMCSRADMFGGGRICATRCGQCKALTATRKLASGGVDAAISVSQYVLDAHRSRNYFRNVPGSVIYNVTTLPEGATPATVDPDPDHLVFGFLGRLDDYKGVRTALEATRRLDAENWRLRVGGTGLEATVKALRAEFTDPRIEWLGFTDADSYFRSIHINIVPSLWADPLPYVVIESHLHGKPILLSDSGGIPEAAALGRKTASFPAGDVAALAALMNAALAARGDWLRGGFRDRDALAAFSVKSIVEQYRAVYRNEPQNGAKRAANRSVSRIPEAAG